MVSADELLKREAGEAAASLVSAGMRVGLGTGSTVHHTIVELGRRVREEGLEIVGVPTSQRSGDLAREVGISLSPLDELKGLDITIDGADEFDPRLHLIKGGGGALLREKVVAMASERMVVVADTSKQVATLGVFPLPIEIVPFAHLTTIRRLADALDCEESALKVRTTPEARLYLTDNDNLIVDAQLGATIEDPAYTEALVRSATGVVEVGLFVHICEQVIMATVGGIEWIDPLE